VSREDEYLFAYKFYSKYTHPTSWIVNGNNKTSLAPPLPPPEYKNIFLVNLQLYAGETIEIFQKKYNQNFIQNHF
jgi:hypothetical protein